jgi:phosphate transport system substrate-binding protein
MKRRGGLAVVGAALLLIGACDDRKVPQIEPVAVAEMSAFYSDADDLRARIRVDEHLPPYDPAQAPRLGAVHLAADRAVLALAQRWTGAFNRSQSLITLRTSTVRAGAPTPWWALERPPAFALLGAPMDEAEVARFRQRWGYAPTGLRVAMDPVVVLVHPDNPIAARGLTLAELEATYAAAPHRGLRRLQRWGELGIDDHWAERRIATYGHDVGGGLAGLFRQAVLERSDYRADMVRLPGSRAVVAAVTRDAAAVGFASLSHTAGTIALVPIAAEEGGPFALPDTDNLVHDRYPLPVGGVWLYINRSPGVVLDAPRREWVRFLYSREGQSLAAELGLVPLPAALAIEELHRHGIDLAPEHALLARAVGPLRLGLGQ